MNTREMLLRAVLESPEEDTVRLAFADWCGEDGESDYAEFIRGQVAWSKAHNTRTERAAAKRVREAFRGVVMLRKWAWLNDLMDGPLQLAVGGDGIPGFYTDKNTKGELRLTRGFVSEIHLPAQAFMQHAEALFSAHPITRVVLSDKRPLRRAVGQASFGFSEWGWCDCRGWSFDGAHELPTELFDGEWETGRLWSDSWRVFDEERLALDSLSARCVAFGREKAGLTGVAA